MQRSSLDITLNCSGNSQYSKPGTVVDEHNLLHLSRSGWYLVRLYNSLSVQDWLDTVRCVISWSFLTTCIYFISVVWLLYVGYRSFFIPCLCSNSQCATVKTVDKGKMVESGPAKGGSCFQTALPCSLKSLKGLLFLRISSIQCCILLGVDTL
jgi:hypothetical protein